MNPNWRTCPVPETITRALRLGHVGMHGPMPIPYVTLWSSELGIDALPCAWVTQLATFPAAGARGVGSPLFKRMESSRQRECMMGRKCQICRVDVHHLGWFCNIPGHQVEAGETLIRQPWLCASCLAYSLCVCPRIATRDDAAPGSQPEIIGGVTRLQFRVAIIGRTRALEAEVAAEGGVIRGDWASAADQVKCVVKRCMIRCSPSSFMALYAPKVLRDWHEKNGAMACR